MVLPILGFELGCYAVIVDRLIRLGFLLVERVEFLNPIAGHHHEVRVVLLLWCQPGQGAHVGLGFGLAFVGAEAVVEMVDHLCLIQREHALAPAYEDVAG